MPMQLLASASARSGVRGGQRKGALLEAARAASLAPRPGLVVGLLLALHAALLAWRSARDSPVLAEVAQLPAGLSVWHLGTFSLYSVNPPLFRALAAVPLTAMAPRTDWTEANPGFGVRPELSVGKAFINANREDWFRYFVAGRLMLVPVAMLGGFACFRFASELYGRKAGYLAVWLWVFDPGVLTWGAYVMPDCCAAALGILAGYWYWRWLKSPDGSSAFLAGLGLGLALLTKFTWVLLFLVWPCLWLWRAAAEVVCRARRGASRRERQRLVARFGAQAAQLAGMMVLAAYMVNLGYGFAGSGQRLGDYRFASRSLAGNASIVDGQRGGNRFRETWLAGLPVPLPRDYIAGIDLQKVDFEHGRAVYLNGAWVQNGRWYYCLEAALLKEPLGTLLLVLLVAVLGALRAVRQYLAAGCNARRAAGQDAPGSAALLVPAATLFAFVSFHHQVPFFRYVLPCAPFVFVWVGQAARRVKAHAPITRADRAAAALVLAAALWSALSSLCVFPHSLSYFNEPAGGPLRGQQYLINAEMDWGQSLWYLKRWWNAHPEARPMHAVLTTSIEPARFGLELSSGEEWAALPLPGHIAAARALQGEVQATGPRPGWLAISVHQVPRPSGGFDYLNRYLRPAAVVGYSIYVYHVNAAQAGEVRRALGLPGLEPTQHQ